MSVNARYLSGLVQVLLVVGLAGTVRGEEAGPSPEEVAGLLQREPITFASWPTWRRRLETWVRQNADHAGPAYDAASQFVVAQAGGGNTIPPGTALANDGLAWYFLGRSYLRNGPPQTDTPGPNPTLTVRAGKTEIAYRNTVRLLPDLAAGHRGLAFALLLQSSPGSAARPPIHLEKGEEARRELEKAGQLDSRIPAAAIEGRAALWQQRDGDAERLFQRALRENPRDVETARGLASCILKEKQRGTRATRISGLLERFPDDGFLICAHAVALALDDDPRAAARELEHARCVGADPRRMLSPEIVDQIEEAAKPSWLEVLAWTFAGFAGFYALVMALMALAGVVLARSLRGTRALELLSKDPTSLVDRGQVLRTRHESGLSRLYGLTLFAGVVLFYLAIPFVIGGLLILTLGLLYLIFHMGRIPVKLVVIVILVGGGGAWAVLKSLFASPGKGSFGLAKSAQDCPRLYQVLEEVAHRVDTDPVDEVYLAPGSSIGVHQEGRGPFGLFGVKRRVLTLGLSTLHFLTIDELRAILAHEYAHFSHKDTFYSRLLYQVDLSIGQALGGMAGTGGAFNYVNPFYWFLVLYYKSYSLLSAGFSRSREFLADRMASTLYGSDVFASALAKVATDGALFEMTVYGNIQQLLAEGKAFVNMYAAFRSFRDEQLAREEREETYKKLLEDNASLFASHPTFRERIEAVEALPKSDHPDTTPALQLFDNVEDVEKELTDFLTGYVQYVQHLQAQAAAQAARG
jgi:Zn-dependent protease with chaperone function